MKEAFELIRKKLEAKEDDCGCGKITVQNALSIVSEVEAEYINKSTGYINKLGDCSTGKDINVLGNGWIPCSERLPEEPEENPEFEGKPVELYLVSFKGIKYPWRAFWNGKDFTDGWDIVNPEAWMPLPEPYKPEKGA